MATPERSDKGTLLPVSTRPLHQSDEVTMLREIRRVYELEYANNQIIAAQFQKLTQSRFYPFILLFLKVSNVLEQGLRRRLGKLPVTPTPTGDPASEFLGTTEESDDEADDVTTEVPLGKWAFRVSLLRRGVHLFLHALKVMIRGNGNRTSPRMESNSYATWVVTYRRYTEHVKKHFLNRLPLVERQPKISIVMATYNTNHQYLREAIVSVQKQIYANFELLIADDCSTDPQVRAIIKEYAAKDERIKLIERTENGNISAATNSAIEAATGEWLAFMDHDDTLVEYALYHVVLALNTNPDATLIYSDEDKINDAGEPFMPYFKSDFDPLLLLGQNYVCHLTTIRRDLVTQLGGLRSAFDGAQDWDLVLRVSEIVDRDTIIHIPHVLYHWRAHAGSTSQSSEAKPWALTAGCRAVEDALARRGIAAEVRELPPVGFADVYYALPENPPLVSIMIPTRDGVYLKGCIESVLATTTYPNYEIVVIDNGSEQQSTLDFFASMGERITVVRDDSPFNYSALHNRAVPFCKGEILCLLNDDTSIITPDWLSAMVAQLLLPGVGLVGAKLLYPDGRVQHAGVLMGPDSLAAHVGKFEAGNAPGYFSRMTLASEFQACTAACIVVRRETWEALEGLDERFQVAFNDIDFCLRVQRSGLKCSYTPHAQLVHYESVSRGLDIEGAKLIRFWGEVARMRALWGLEIARDPYYNPNLALQNGLFELAYPPRTSPFYTGIE